MARCNANFVPPTGIMLDANTAGLWRFEEGSGNTVSDGSLSGYNGSLSGASWSTEIP